MVENLYIGRNPKGATELIERFNANSDSTSGILTQPKIIEAGESVTIPAGRGAVLPNIQVDGEINIQNGGEILILSGGISVRDTVVLKAPNDSLWELKVSNTGELSTEVYNG